MSIEINSEEYGGRNELSEMIKAAANWIRQCPDVKVVVRFKAEFVPKEEKKKK